MHISSEILLFSLRLLTKKNILRPQVMNFLLHAFDRFDTSAVVKTDAKTLGFWVKRKLNVFLVDDRPTKKIKTQSDKKITISKWA